MRRKTISALATAMVIGSSAVIAPAHAETDDGGSMIGGESFSVASAVAHLDTPKEQFEMALELGAEPDEYGLIEFDEPIDEQVVGDQVFPVLGIIDPAHVDLDQIDAVLDLSAESEKPGGIAPQSQVACGNNPMYVWIRSGANMCFVPPGRNFGQSNPYSVSRVCTNLYSGVQARTWYNYGPYRVPTPSAYRGGVGCWDFTGNVPAYRAQFRNT